jgi:hypothetical protein
MRVVNFTLVKEYPIPILHVLGEPQGPSEHCEEKYLTPEPNLDCLVIQTVF